MVGTAPEGKGGIASVVSVYIENGLFESFPIRYIATHREGSIFQKIACSVVAFLKIFFLLVTGQVAVLHAQVASHGSFKRKSIYLALARAAGVPTVFHLHGGGFRKFTDELASPRLRRWIVHTLKRSTYVFGLSQAWVEYLRGIAPGAKVLAVANPVHLPNQTSRESEQAGRVLFLGRADQHKGVFDLLEAFRQVVDQLPTASLAIGGDGDLTAVRERVQALGLGERVEVLGWVAGEAKLAQVARAQVFVLPSYDEGLPMAMLESMARAKAIVVTPVGGIPEAVQHEQQGLLVLPGQPDELAVALLRLLKDDEFRHRLGDRARQRVQERFSTDVVLRQVGEVYRELGVPERNRR
ncbi:glycosyltransferase involved in cell wall biosynthesis [Paucibacter oligotrophus]|uniref:Glycosyltransferase involved in cell wall biosynthesis n=2 Tax=Roseateles oligotrophus TaxID=1769250 RepID=A0A840L1G2_9BURK|nr:glycosyltransferase family 4 protein [Roseateles oligotrophus]MBB4842294.1 glycosyltransferase involved in cell wall biosynthesis [Roseateles oligotrophus]